MLNDMASASNVLVLAGSSAYYKSPNATGTCQLVGAAQIVIHPSYSPTSQAQTDDIALIKVLQELIFNRGLGPACLPTTYGMNAFDNTNVDLVGYGSTSFGGPLSPSLLKTTVNTIPNYNCSGMGWGTLSNGQICTYLSGYDACQYDSGKL